MSEVSRVTLVVNGTDEYEVISEDSFTSWRAEIPLTTDTRHTITVSVEDEHGNADPEAATAKVHQQDWETAFPDDEKVFLQAAGRTYDEEEQRGIVSDDESTRQ